MAANGRGNMRPAGRSPPFLAIGLFVALVILGFNYWSLSARNGEQSNEISLMESELRLVNAKKTSAEKRGEAISDKVTELERQLNEQKEVIAKNQADLANVEKEKQTFIERTNELENEVKNIRDQQLPSCETDKKNLQQEVEQLRADIEIHKNKQCDLEGCRSFLSLERDATIEDMYKVVGVLPLISMLRGGVNVGKYKDQILSLAEKMDHDALAKQQPQQQPQAGLDIQPRDSPAQQQPQAGLDIQPRDSPAQEQPSGLQQQQPVESMQQQPQPGDSVQQQQPADTQQQQPADTQQQQPADPQQQQQQPADMQQQQPADMQQQQPVDVMQQQQPPADTQQQQQSDVQQQLQPVEQNAETGQGAVQSNVDDRDTLKAANADAQVNPDGTENKANMSKTAVVESEQKTEMNVTKNTTTTTATTANMKAGGMNDIPPKAPLDTVTRNVTTANNKPTVQNGDEVDADVDDYEDEEDLEDDKDKDVDTALRVHDNDEGDEYDYEDDDDDNDDDYNYDEKTKDEIRLNENPIDEMYRKDKDVVDTHQ